MAYRQERTIFVKGAARLRIRLHHAVRVIMLKLARTMRGY